MINYRKKYLKYKKKYLNLKKIYGGNIYEIYYIMNDDGKKIYLNHFYNNEITKNIHEENYQGDYCNIKTEDGKKIIEIDGNDYTLDFHIFKNTIDFRKIMDNENGHIIPEIQENILKNYGDKIDVDGFDLKQSEMSANNLSVKMNLNIQEDTQSKAWVPLIWKSIKKCFNIPDDIIEPTYYDLEEDYKQYEDKLNEEVANLRNRNKTWCHEVLDYISGL